MEVVVGARTGPLSVADLTTAYPWPDDGPWLRSMMVMTLDGAAVGPDGRSRSISSTSDREVLATTRRFCDVVLIGAGTFRAERYRPMRARLEDADARAANGQSPAPILAIASASLDLPWDEAAFNDPDSRAVVLTTQSADPARLEMAFRCAHVLALPSLEARAIIAALREQGWRRIVCEGGPTLLAELVRMDLVDEADLTLSPLMTGGGQFHAGPTLPVPSGFALHQLIVDGEGFLYARYLRSEGDRTGGTR